MEKKARLLLYITIAWNVFEGVSSMLFGFLTGSLALFAYGLESSVEVFTSSVVLWHLEGKSKRKEKIALKLIGWAYLVVSLYIFIDGLRNILNLHHPDRSFTGVVLMAITAIMMFSLGVYKRKIGKEMGSEPVLADAKFSLIDGSLACTVLVGVLCNTLLGWWWIDQALALFLSGIAFREGLKQIL